MNFENSRNSAASRNSDNNPGRRPLDRRTIAPVRQLRATPQIALNSATRAATVPNLPPQPATLSKSDFADLCNVDRSRISHWIRDGRISGKALAGTGRSARIVVEIAQAQLRGNLDPYQMMPTGNGARTRLESKEVDRADLPEAGADILWQVVAELPRCAAWSVLEHGGGLQLAFDVVADLLLDIPNDMLRGFAPIPVEIGAVDWRELAAAYELGSIDPAALSADYERRRNADD